MCRKPPVLSPRKSRGVHTARMLTEARTTLTEIRGVHAQVEPLCKHLQTLMEKANHIEKQIKEFLDRRP